MTTAADTQAPKEDTARFTDVLNTLKTVAEKFETLQNETLKRFDELESQKRELETEIG